MLSPFDNIIKNFPWGNLKLFILCKFLQVLNLHLIRRYNTQYLQAGKILTILLPPSVLSPFPLSLPRPLSTKLVNGHMTNSRYQTLIFIIGVGNVESHKNRDLILNTYLYHTSCMTMSNLIFLCLSLSICKIRNNSVCHLGLLWGDITIFFLMRTSLFLNLV